MYPLLILLAIAGLIFTLWLGSVFVRRIRQRQWLEELQTLPEAERQARLADQEKKKNLGCLSAYMLLVMVANVGVGILAYLAAGASNVTAEAKTIDTIGAGMNFLAAIFAGVVFWGHKKWAVYGIYGVIALSILANIATGYTAGVLQNLVPIVILTAVVRPVWNYLD
jgi:hypothetical protein